MAPRFRSSAAILRSSSAATPLSPNSHPALSHESFSASAPLLPNLPPGEKEAAQAELASPSHLVMPSHESAIASAEGSAFAARAHEPCAHPPLPAAPQLGGAAGAPALLASPAAAKPGAKCGGSALAHAWPHLKPNHVDASW